jgi:hypothetical protein
LLDLMSKDKWVATTQPMRVFDFNHTGRNDDGLQADARAGEGNDRSGCGGRREKTYLRVVEWQAGVAGT